MVSLQQHRPAAGKMPLHGRGDAAGIRTEAQECSLRLYTVSYTLVRVVRRRKRGDLKILDTKRDLFFHRDQIVLHGGIRIAQTPPHRRGRVHRDGVVPEHHPQSGDMVGVLVGDEDAAQVLEPEALAHQRGADAPHGDPRGDQYLRTAAPDQGAVAR